MLDLYSQSCHNEYNVKITDAIFVGYVQWGPSTIQTKINNLHLARKMPCSLGYITKKVAIHVVTVYHAAYILLTVHRTDAVCVVQSTITVQPQAHPTMLLASV